MKVFIIHTIHTKSLEYAAKAMRSFDGYSGWEPELFEGIIVDTLPLYENNYSIETKELSRAADYFRENLTKYAVKKCCSLNHYRLFKKCVELNEPIVVIEHDSHCVGDWDNYIFEDILVLNAASAMKQDTLKPIWDNNKTPPSAGIHNINLVGLNYRHDEAINGSHMMPGTAAYAMTPQAARKMIDVYEKIGWEQSDFIINTAYVQIQTIMPEIFTFKLPNLAMSHGKNLS